MQERQILTEGKHFNVTSFTCIISFVPTVLKNKKLHSYRCVRLDNVRILLVFFEHSAVFLVADKFTNLLFVKLRIFFDELDDFLRIQRSRQQLMLL